MLSVHDILLGVVVPIVIGALLAAFVRVKSAGGAIGVGIGFVLGYVLLFGWTGARPANDFEWIVPVGLLATVVWTLAEVMQFRWMWGGGVVIAVEVWLILRSQQGVAALVGLMVLGWIWWALWDRLLLRSRGPWAGVVMTGVAGFTALVLMLSDSQRIGQMGLALTASAMAAWVMGWVLKRDLWRSAGFVWAVVLYGLLLDGKFWAGLTWINAALLLIAPLGAWVGEAPFARRATGWKLAVIRVGVVVLPVLAATILAVLEFQRAQQSSGAEYY